MRRSIVLALLVGLALAPSAQAKGVGKVQACDVKGCRTLDREVAESAIFGAPPVAGPRGPVQAITLRITPRDDRGQDLPRFEMHFAPSVGLVRGDSGTWMQPTAEGLRALRRATAGLDVTRAVDGTPRPRVVETFAPAATAADDGSTTWPWWAGGGALALLTAAALVRRQRSRASTAASSSRGPATTASAPARSSAP